MNLIEFYTSVLTGFGLSVDFEDLVFLDTGKGLAPVKIDSKQICLPTKDHLRDSPWDKYVPFHPICENSAKGEYPTLKWLRKQANYNLSKLIGELWAGLAIVANNKDLHSGMNPNQITMLKIAHEIDGKCVKALQTILSDKVTLSGNGRIIALTQKQGGNVEGETFKRFANVSFPITEQFEHEKDILGLELRKKDMKTIKGLFEYIFPNHEDINAFNFGSNESVAPYFHSLLGAYYNVAARIKELALDFDNLLPNALLFRSIDLEWIEHLSELNKYKGLVPSLDGNRFVENDSVEEKRVGFGSNLASKVTDFKADIPAVKTDTAYDTTVKASNDIAEPPKPLETKTNSEGPAVVEWNSRANRDRERERERSRDYYDRDDRDSRDSRNTREYRRPQPRLDAREQAKLDKEDQLDFIEDFYRATGYEPDRRDFDEYFEDYLSDGKRLHIRRESNTRDSRGRDDRDRGRDSYSRPGDRFYSGGGRSNSVDYSRNRR